MRRAHRLGRANPEAGLPAVAAGRFRTWALAALCALGGPAAAETFPHFYQGTVYTQADTPAEEDVAQALSQVLRRLTGDAKLSEHPLLQDLFTRPGRFMTTFVWVAAQGDRKAHLRIGFSSRLLHDYLDSAGIPSWGDDRPRILVAHLHRDGVAPAAVTLGKVQSRNLDLPASLRQVSLERGIIWQLPNGDLEDLRLLREAVRGREPQGSHSAMRLLERYGAQGMLLAVDERTGAGRSFTSWQLYGELRGTLPMAPEIGAFDLVLHEVADIYTERSVRRAGYLEEVLLVVEKVTGFAAAYRLTGALLSSLGPDAASLLAMEDDRLEFRIVFDRGALALRKILGEQIGLQPIQRPPSPGGGLEMYYSLAGL